MDFLGIGPLELLFILLIALIIFGPKDIVKTSRVIGRFLRKLVKSPGWQSVQQTSRELRNLPNKLMRDAGLEEMQEELNQIGNLTKTPDLTKEIQKEFNQVEKGMKAWTSLDLAEKEEKPEDSTQEDQNISKSMDQK
jgi:Sec-independent protein translocase protein TatA